MCAERYDPDEDPNDLYVILGVPTTATTREIRKAYYRQAREWHPDHNPDRIQVSTERFRLIQAAYETLSDPNDRAWFDEHRQHGVAAVNETEERIPRSVNLIPYIFGSKGRWTSFDDDDPTGFYQLFGGVFRQIWDQEVQFGPPNSRRQPLPDFGNSTTRWRDVKDFYLVWGRFSTTKTFSWIDQLDVSKATNRRNRKFYREENRKGRRKEKAKFDKEVKQFVRFVRRRDERRTEHLKKAKIAIRKRIEKESLIAEIRRLEDGNLTLEEEEGEESGEADEDSPALDRDLQSAQDELESFFDTQDGVEDVPDPYFVDISATEEEPAEAPEPSQSQSQSGPSQPKKRRGRKRNRRNKLRKKMQMIEEQRRLATLAVEDQTEESDVPSRFRADDEVAPPARRLSKRERKELRRRKQLSRGRGGQAQSVDESSDTNWDEDLLATASRSKRRPRKKRKRKEPNAPRRSECRVCHEVFDSRRKLFDHLKETGHALAV